jgi:anti-anti-sigma factor
MLKVNTQKVGEVTVLHLKGRVVTGETEVLLNAVLSESDASVVVLDFARVKAIDARGLGVLLQLREQTQSKGIEFKLMNVTRLVRQVFEITCLNTVFEVCSEAEVLSKASGHQPASAVETSTTCTEANS